MKAYLIGGVDLVIATTFWGALRRPGRSTERA
ncbi:hypothetical protein GGR00_005515 [Aminobacter aganoensis]|uniref:Uncharacterized protein n=1 Tax=Aminobacter aganoensis TaxID=83264 RepID=A0A7X0KP02_9HYPH|nr:hypothetical protein [Aminobacter aganoensis]